MQDEKHQKRQSAKNFAEDSTMKSLFNTLFMMFNSRYRGATVHKVMPPTSQRRIGRMYYILKERSIIKHFAGPRGGVLEKGTSAPVEKKDTKRRLVVGYANNSLIFYRVFLILWS